MNRLKSYFRFARTKSPVQENTQPEVAPSADKALAEVFIDTTPPPHTYPGVQGPTLQQLAAQDLTEPGRLAGFEYHDMEIFRLMQENYKAAFIQALNGRMEQLDELLSKYTEELGKLEGEAMELTRRTIRASRERYAVERMRLEEQRMLVLGNSGMAEMALTSFQVGFRQGYARYIESLALTAKYKV